MSVVMIQVKQTHMRISWSMASMVAKSTRSSKNYDITLHNKLFYTGKTHDA